MSDVWLPEKESPGDEAGPMSTPPGNEQWSRGPGQPDPQRPTSGLPPSPSAAPPLGGAPFPGPPQSPNYPPPYGQAPPAYGTPPPATGPKKSHTGLIIGLVAAGVVLVLLCCAGGVAAVVAVRANDQPDPGTYEGRAEGCTPVEEPLRAAGFTLTGPRDSRNTYRGSTVMACSGNITRNPGDEFSLLSLTATAFRERSGKSPTEVAQERYDERRGFVRAPTVRELDGIGDQAFLRTRPPNGTPPRVVQSFELTARDDNLTVDLVLTLIGVTPEDAERIATAIVTAYIEAA